MNKGEVREGKNRLLIIMLHFNVVVALFAQCYNYLTMTCDIWLREGLEQNKLMNHPEKSVLMRRKELSSVIRTDYA